MRRLIIIAGALALASCGQSGVNSAGSVAAGTADMLGFKVPATLTRTSADEKAISDAWLVFEAFLKGEQAARKAGKLIPGTPKAIAVANGIDRVTAALQSASAAQQALNAEKWSNAWREATLAFADAQRALKGN